MDTSDLYWLGVSTCTIFLFTDVPLSIGEGTPLSNKEGAFYCVNQLRQ